MNCLFLAVFVSGEREPQTMFFRQSLKVGEFSFSDAQCCANANQMSASEVSNLAVLCESPGTI